jgi:adenylate kinase family enzyme
MNKGNAILITGPGGAGKTTLSNLIGTRAGFHVISEDALWVEIKRGHPEGELRTQEEECVVQNRVLDEARAKLSLGTGIVIEFVLYCDPPRPLLAYRNALEPVARTLVLALNPSVSAIMRRKELRGREFERDIERETTNAVHQRNCLMGNSIRAEWLVDNSDLSAEQVYNRYIAPFLAEQEK